MQLRKLISLFCLALAASFPSSATDFKIGSRTLSVPEGFEIEVIASPPLVNRPISADFDEQGRLYVTDSSGSNDKPDKQLEEKPHRIVCLEDTDGDGKFDKSTVFADKMMFPEGAMWRDGSLYVCAPPSIWKITASDGGTVSDRREEWFQGKTLTGCANDLHGPYAGPDGWIYWCKGAFAKQTYERPGREPFVTRAAHIFRCRPDGSGIEPVMTGGMDNPVGVVFTETGERILSGTFFQNPEGGKRDGLIHAIYGGVYGKIHDVIDEHPRTGDVLPIMSHFGPAAPCGITRYRSQVFGTNYENNLFTCCFNLHKVIRSILVPDGATFHTIDSDFLTSDDPDFHPTGVLEDADGSLIVLDTGGWYKLCCPTSQLAKPDVLGAIYRIRRKGAPKVNDPRGLSINWSHSAFFLIDDPRPMVRDRAIAQLVAEGKKYAEPLGNLLGDPDYRHKYIQGRRNALWALTQVDSPIARSLVVSALLDSDNTVRHVAALSAGLWRDHNALPKLEKLLSDEDAQVRRAAAEALGRIGDPKAVPPILDAAAKLDDHSRALEHSLIYALIEIGNQSALADGLQSGNSHVRRVALIAADQMPHGKLDPATVAPLLISPDPILKTTANWIVSRHHDWGGALAEFFEQRLSVHDVSDDEPKTLETLLVPLAGDPAIQDLLTRTVASGHAWAGNVALHVMAQSNLKPSPNAWILKVATRLESHDPDQLRECIATARALNVPKGGGTELYASLKQIGNETDLKPETRLSALAALGPSRSLSPPLFVFVTANVDISKPWNVRNDAVTVLTKAKLDDSQLLQLATLLRQVSPMELPRLLSAFENSTNEAVGLRLIEDLKAAKAISSLRTEMLQPKLAKYPASVQAKAEELYKMLNTDAAKQKQHLDELQAQLPPGDIRRGQAIFNNPKVACSSCHAMGYLGGHVGPDLTAIGTIRTERDLLESIVYPSASFVRSYEPTVVVTKSGDSYTGIVRKDTADEVMLVSGPQAEIHVARADIAEMHPGTVSIMPQGLDEQLNKQELSDLLAFLKNTKWGPK